VLSDFQFVNAVRKLAVSPRLLNAETQVRMLQRDALLVAARGIDDLSLGDGTLRVDPVSPTPTVGG